jgi:two-component system phosphate regulon sensor histidine kinase PhoR
MDGGRSSWRVTVADRGIGVPAEHLERIFDRFHRVPTGDRHDVKGFGLGLHYVRSIVEGHGGQIRCTQREGGGSVFTIDLPNPAP